MPDNDDLSARAKQLLADVQSITQDAKNACDSYRNLSAQTYANLQAYLKTQNVTTADEWLQKCQQELSPDEQTIVQQTLSDLTPPQGIAALVQPTEIAKFIASLFIAKGAMPAFRVAALGAKEFYYNYLVINRLPVADAGAVAGEVEMTSIASTTEELSEASTFIEGDEVPAMVSAADAEIAGIVDAEVAEAAEVASIATADAASAWNVFFLAVGAAVLAGTYAYQKVQESDDADALDETIAKVATARLYALVSEKSLLVQTDENGVLSLLNQALQKQDGTAADFFKQQASATIQSGVAAVDVNACYQQLQAQDQSRGAMTDADPSLQDMMNRHAQDVQSIKAGGGGS